MQKNLLVAAFTALGLSAGAGTTDFPRRDPPINERFGASRRANP